MDNANPDLLKVTSQCIGYQPRTVLTPSQLVAKLADCIIGKTNRGKYLEKAIALIYEWAAIEDRKRKQGLNEGDAREQSHIITLQIQDILNACSEKEGLDIICQLFDLIKKEHAQATTAADSVIWKTVRRLFSMISAAWFFESAANEIEVRLTA